MTWTYSGVPGDSTVDTVRFLAGLTSSGMPGTLTDEEITYLAGIEGSVYLAASASCQRVATYYAAGVQSRRVGELTLTYGDRAAEFSNRALELRRRGAVNGGTFVYAGGVSVADKRTNQCDTDRVTPEIARNMDDIPGTNQTAREVTQPNGAGSTGWRMY